MLRILQPHLFIYKSIISCFCDKNTVFSFFHDKNQASLMLSEAGLTHTEANLTLIEAGFTYFQATP